MMNACWCISDLENLLLKPSTDDRFSSAENRSCVMRNRSIFVVRQNRKSAK